MYETDKPSQHRVFYTFPAYAHAPHRSSGSAAQTLTAFEKLCPLYISHSGYSQETAHTLKIAKKNGAVTVALTHSLRSPITEHADFVLVNGNKQGKLQGDSIGTKIAQLFVLDLIYALLVQAEQERAVKTKQKTLDVILEQRIK